MCGWGCRRGGRKYWKQELLTLNTHTKENEQKKTVPRNASDSTRSSDLEFSFAQSGAAKHE